MRPAIDEATTSSEEYVADYIDTSKKENLLSDAKYFECKRSFVIGEMNVFSLDKDKNLVMRYSYTPKPNTTYDPNYFSKPNSVVCLSSVYVGYLEALGLEDLIVGVDDLDNISNEIVRNNKNIIELGGAGQLNMEALLALDPKYVFVDDFDIDNGMQKELKEAGIMLVRCNPFREETPLARAEWIKFFGVIFDKYKESETLFDDTKFNYHLLRKQALNYTKKPDVFLNAPYGDQWTIPGGNSFQAKLMYDAGANYVFNKDTSTMTLHSGFEEMIVKAKDAEFWLHLGTANTRKELLEINSNFNEFKAFQLGNLFNNTKNTNEKGGIPYWENSGVHPDWVLDDLIHIFHPEKNANFKSHYYIRVN